MLDRLPTELLLEVLRWTRHYPWEDYYKTHEHQRKITLCYCARVCKQIGAAAESLIWRNIQIKSDDKAKQILAITKDRTRACYARELVVDSRQWPKSCMGMVIKAFPHLSKVSIAPSIWQYWKMTEAEAASIRALRNLTTLVLRETELTASSVAALIPLPSLSTLIMRRCTIEQDDIAQLFSATVTPNLKVIEFYSFVREVEPGARFPYFPRLPQHLFPRIERMELSSGDFCWGPEAVSVPAPSGKILFVLNYSEDATRSLPPLHPAHVALPDFHVPRTVDVWPVEEDAVQILQRPLPRLISSTLKSIGISAVIRKPFPVQPLAVAAAYSALLRAAEAHDVDVWWYEEDAFEAFGRYLKGKGVASGGEGR